MADGDSRVGALALLRQQHGERLADEVRSPTDDDVLAVRRVATPHEELLHAVGRRA